MGKDAQEIANYGSRDSRKKELADKDLGYIEMKYRYYMLKIAFLSIYEKCKNNPGMRKIMKEMYEVIHTREQCLMDIDCDIHEIVNEFEEYRTDIERLEWFEKYFLTA